MINKKIKKMYLKAFFISAVLYSISNISLFGIKDLVDKQSQDFFNIYAGDLIYSEEARNSYAIALITDETLKEPGLQNTWPYSADSYALILDSILALEPKSVFVDIQWKSLVDLKADCSSPNTHDSPNLYNLVKTLEFYAEENIPIYLAVAEKADLCKLPNSIVQLIKPVSVQFTPDSHDGVARSYPLNRKPLNSAALALCQYHLQAQCIDNDKTSMNIFWGTKENLYNTLYKKKNTQTQGSILFSGKQAIVDSNPYSSMVFIENIVNPKSFKVKGESQDQTAFNNLKKLIQGKTLFLGANISASQDFILSPTGKKRPGVFYHAMAFDNLINYRNNIKNNNSNLARDIIKFTTIFLISLISIILSSDRRKRNRKAVYLKNRKNVPSRVKGLLFQAYDDSIFIAISLIIVLITCYINYYMLNQPASSWLGYFSLIFFSVYASKMELAKKIKETFLYIAFGKTRK